VNAKSTVKRRLPAGLKTAEAGLESTLTQIARPRTLGDEAYEQLRHALMSGQLRPGQQITVRGLADALGISLTPAREAMGRLSAEGVLAEGPNRTVLVPRLTQRDYGELIIIRLALEPLAAGRAADRMSSADVAALRELQEGMRKAHAERNYQLVLRCNEQFHFFLYGKANMPTLEKILESLWLRIGPTLTLLHESGYTDGSWKGDTNHGEILAGLARRDAVRVSNAVRKDLEDGSARLLELLESDEPGLPRADPGSAGLPSRRLR
jgi:DNA-binding GntR family transcriptional regulator